MAVTRIFWSKHDGYDIHVVRGAKPSRRLDADLVLEIDNGDDHIVASEPLPAGVTVRFEASFPGAVSIVTGAVAASKPAPQLRNFVVRAVVRDPSRLDPFEAFARVHVHRSIRAIRLTPSTLSVHEGIKDDEHFRFSVLADFDDGITGDISNWDELLWSSADAGKVAVSAFGDLEPRAAGADVEITVALDPNAFPAPIPGPARARVRTLPSWSTFAGTAELKYVSGSGPGPRRIAQATNVLFVSEGFTEGEEGDFDALVKTIVQEFRTMRTVRPLSFELKGAINYWKAFVALPNPAASGLSVLSECVTFEVDGPFRGMELDAVEPAVPKKPDVAAQKWTVGNLVHEVGLPVPGEDGLVPRNARFKDQAAPIPLETKLEHWKKLYGQDSNGQEFTTARITEDRYKRWCFLAQRVLLNERDTVFHLSLGGRPRLDREHLANRDVAVLRDEYREPKSLLFHPRRTTRERFHEFLVGLRVGNTAVGSTWTTGKDRGLVCVVARIKRARAAYRPGDGFFYIALDEMKFHPLDATANGVELVAGAPGLPDRRRLTTALTTVHELGHALGLGDEYGEEDRLPAAREDKVAFEPNVQLERSVRATSGAGLDGQKVRTQLRWLWPRVRAGGILTRRPQPLGTDLVVGNVLTISLEKGQGRLFQKDDVVFLRRRPLAAQSEPVPWLRVTDQPQGDEVRARVIVGVAFPAPVKSDVFVGVSDKKADERASVLLTAVLFPTQPLDPSGVPNFYPLVAPTIVEHMAKTRGPLDAPRGSPTQACDPAKQKERKAKSDITIPKNLPTDLFERLPAQARNTLRKQPYLIIGLYQGGSLFHCGAFHPGGVCLMNSHRNRRERHRFCHVCRYLLIDRVDPTRHGRIDALYAADEYPEPP